MTEKISIIVPIYNVEQYLGRCIDSLIKQKYRNIEILLIDDCSTDKSADIAREYTEKNPNICRFISLTKNVGVSGVRNYGLSMCQGQWVSFVDSDDWVDEEYISSMYKVAREDDADIVMSGCTYIWDDKRKKDMFIPQKLNTFSLHKDKIALCRCSVTAKLINKNLLYRTQIEFPQNIRRLEELCMMVPLFTYTDRISIINKSYYYYFQRTNSSSNQNMEDTNLNFFTESVERMYTMAKPGFDESLEFRVICELMYGLVMTMIRCKKPRREVVNKIIELNNVYSNWTSNTYLVHLPKLKKLFLMCVRRKWYLALKTMVYAWDIKQRK